MKASLTGLAKELTSDQSYYIGTSDSLVTASRNIEHSSDKLVSPLYWYNLSNCHFTVGRDNSVSDIDINVPALLEIFSGA